MSGRLCCYTASNYNILSYWLSIRSLFKVSAIRFNTRTKTRAPPPDCHINNALIEIVPSCQTLHSIGSRTHAYLGEKVCIIIEALQYVHTTNKELCMWCNGVAMWCDGVAI